MARDVSDSTPISSKAELVGWIAQGEKPAKEFRLGTEHEKFPFYRDDLSPVPYEGAAAGRSGGIRQLLEAMQARLGWEPILDAGHVIGLAGPDGGGAISLEPGGQFELSGAPLANVHETARELDQHLADLKAVAEPHGIGFLALGHSPLWTREQTPMMPKRRYEIMKNYMPKVGTRGLDMMFRTCTVQVNLDFASEADMVRKLRVALALQPLAAALFAASPFSEGGLNGFQSMRSEIWRDTDNARSGILPFAFDAGMSYEAYVDWALDVPMYFVKRGDTYHDVAGASFRDLLAGKLPQLPGERATMSDWANHLSTLFPEARLKRYIEMRGADAGPVEMLNALPAFWVGLLYDEAALAAAWTSSGSGAPRSGRACATPFRRRGSMRGSGCARCAIWPARWSSWRAPASPVGHASTDRAVTRRIISSRSSRSPRAAARSPSVWPCASKGPGAARSSRCFPNWHCNRHA